MLVQPSTPSSLYVPKNQLWVPQQTGLIVPESVSSDATRLHASLSRRHIIPPYIQDKLEGGEDRLKKDEVFRTRRLEATEQFLRGVRKEFAPKCVRHREVYDCEGAGRKGAKLERKEGQGEVGDDQVDLAYQHAGNIFRFATYLIDKGYLPGNYCLMDQSFKIYVRYDENPHDGASFFNAFYDSRDNSFVFGHIEPDAKDAKYFRPLVLSTDVFGHETGHGIIDALNPIVYRWVPGLLNESIADCIGISFLHFLNQTTATEALSDWEIGGQILVEGALRNMLEPGQGHQNHELLGNDPQPAHVLEILDLSRGIRGNLGFGLMVLFDQLGVHIFSGLANKPFAETALMMGAKTYEEPLHIRLKALQEVGKTSPNGKPTVKPGLVQFALTEERVARELYGENWAAAVREGWATTGVLKSQIRRGFSLEALPDRLNPFG